jgi:ABC-type polysaccharide/polyol phosphate export permease
MVLPRDKQWRSVFDFMIKSNDSLIKGPLEKPKLWLTMAWLDVVQSYRRSFLGPMWITLNMAIFSVAMTLVYGAIFGIPTKEYSAYIITGMIGWTWVAALLVEVGNTFIVYGSYVKSTTIDKGQMVWAMAFKQVIVLAHNMIIFVLAVAVGVVHLDYYTLLFIPNAVLFFLISVPLTGCLSILFARYRDLPRLVASTMVVIMLLTPVFWQPAMITGWRQALIHLNPVYYAIEFLRRPLLGLPPDPVISCVFLALAALIWIFGRLFCRRYLRYVAFWI